VGDGAGQQVGEADDLQAGGKSAPNRIPLILPQQIRHMVAGHATRHLREG